jgi:hypothetical protein
MYLQAFYDRGSRMLYARLPAVCLACIMSNWTFVGQMVGSIATVGVKGITMSGFSLTDRQFSSTSGNSFEIRRIHL